MKIKVTYSQVKAALENGFISPLNTNETKKISVKCSNAQEIPSEEIFSNGEVVVTKALIQDDYEYAYVKFFVDHRDGRAFGGSYSASEAVKLCNVMAELV